MSNEAVIAQALIEYGNALRVDWSDFDGRQAQSVLHDFAFELRGTFKPSTIEKIRAQLGLCPDGNGHWEGKWGHCDPSTCPTYAAEQAQS